MAAATLPSASTRLDGGPHGRDEAVPAASARYGGVDFAPSSGPASRRCATSVPTSSAALVAGGRAGAVRRPRSRRSRCLGHANQVTETAALALRILRGEESLAQACRRTSARPSSGSPGRAGRGRRTGSDSRRRRNSRARQIVARAVCGALEEPRRRRRRGRVRDRARSTGSTRVGRLGAVSRVSSRTCARSRTTRSGRESRGRTRSRRSRASRRTPPRTSAPASRTGSSRRCRRARRSRTVRCRARRRRSASSATPATARSSAGYAAHSASCSRTPTCRRAGSRWSHSARWRGATEPRTARAPAARASRPAARRSRTSSRAGGARCVVGGDRLGAGGARRTRARRAPPGRDLEHAGEPQRSRNPAPLRTEAEDPHRRRPYRLGSRDRGACRSSSRARRRPRTRDATCARSRDDRRCAGDRPAEGWSRRASTSRRAWSRRLSLALLGDKSTAPSSRSSVADKPRSSIAQIATPDIAAARYLREQSLRHHARSRSSRSAGRRPRPDAVVRPDLARPELHFDDEHADRGRRDGILESR